jgi:hypothetical protein
MTKDSPALIKIRETRGMASRLAEHLGITREAVSMWPRVPPRHAFKVAKFLEMPVHDVCPEIVPEPPEEPLKRRTKGSSRSAPIA